MLNHDAKFSKVPDLAAERSNWGSDLPPKWGRGIAINKSSGTIVCEVVEVEIKPEGTPIVHRVTCVADPGLAIHPNGFTAQMESGMVYGLTAALYGEINIQNGAVKQSNFHDYQMLRIDEIPEVKTYIDNSGELGTPPIGPALANAIFAATGTRIRELPVKNHDLG